MDISYQYAKLRCNYGRQPMFCERGPEMCDTIATDKAEFKQYILRNPVHQLTQHTPVFWQHKVNTIRTEYASTGANHAEGGWPKDVLVTDPEATQRYRRKVEKDDNYIHCITSAAPGMDHYVSQNNAIDMYRTYYVEMPSMPDVERSSCRLVNVYRDVAGGRPVSSVCWQPDGQRYAVTYVDMDWNRLPRAALECYLWDVDNMNYPEVTLTPPCPLLDLQFNQRHPEMLAGALMSGQVGVWDRRAGGLARLVSAAHAAHRDLVRNVLFINAKSGQELFSAGPDGAVKWWDVRNMSEPTDEMILDAVKSSFDVPSMPKANGASVLEFEPTVPSRFFVGTENGRVLSGNRKGKTPMEKLPLQFEAHLGPVWSVERNPNFLKNFLTVGDWTARVWSEDCRDSSIIMSPPGRHKITHGTWSPTRMSLMVLTQWNGVLAVWDLLRRQHEPTLAVQVCQEPLMTVRMHESGTLAACGSRRGNVYMVELSANLARSYRSDKGILTAVLERESKRERILEARLRELRLRRTQPEERSPRGSARDVAAGADRDLTDAAAAYVQHARRELAAINSVGAGYFCRAGRGRAGAVTTVAASPGAVGMWQSEEARCGVVLREVFAWLDGAQLARAGAACRAWRRAAADPPLWRRLVLRAATAATTADDASRARDVLLATTENYEWREEYVNTHAPWRECGRVVAGAGGAALLHGALAPRDPWLALAADDASVAVWAHATGAWRERCRLELRTARGWASAARVLWAAEGRRLLVAGPRALADVASALELLVLQFDEECVGRVVSRARCGAGAAGCWADRAGRAYLSLETSVLAPGLACTTVWLNAATQETQSEYAGVTTRLLRVYNEDSANILHALVLELPWSAVGASGSSGDLADYYRATRAASSCTDTDSDSHETEGEWSSLRVLVLGWDGGRSGGGAGGGVSLWSLGAPQQPPLEAQAAGSLRTRYLAHRERARAPPPAEPPPPDEHAVRALCSAPEAACALPAPPLGIAPHPRGRCLWVSTADALVVCVSVPALVPLRSLAPAGPLPAPRPALPAPNIYYAQLSASEHHVAVPLGALCGSWGARVCSALCGAAPAHHTLKPHPPAPPVAALLLAGSPFSVIVLAGDAFYVLQQRRACCRGVSTSWSGATPPPAPAPCPPRAPPPACRARPARPLPALRVVCRAPAAGQRPPCPQPLQTPPVSCVNLQTNTKSSNKSRSRPRLNDASGLLRCNNDERGECGAQQDRVAQRLAAAEAARRSQHEREVAAPRARVAAVPRALYRLGGPREIAPDAACRMHSAARLDPCAHRPRLLLQMDRSHDFATASGTSELETVMDKPDPSAAVPQDRSLKSRIINSFTQAIRPLDKELNPGITKYPKSTPCSRRKLHTATGSLSNDCPHSAIETKTTAERAGGLEGMLRERNALQEAGRGRTICGSITKNKSCRGAGVGGQLELAVPAGARRVRVRVALEDECGESLAAGARGAGRHTQRRHRTAGPTEDVVAITDAPDSWLSIKTLQKKISGYTRGDDPESKRKGDSSNQKTGTSPSNRCGTPHRSPSPVPKQTTNDRSKKSCPPPSPCAPKIARAEEKDKPKHRTRYLPLSLTVSPLP